MFRFFKSVQCVRVRNRKRKGDTLVEFNLGIKETDGLGFGQAESVEDFHSLLFQARVDPRIDAV